MNYNGKKILITGGAGFIGSNLVKTITSRWPDAEICVLDAFVNGHFKNLIGYQGELIAGDLTDENILRQLKDRHFDVIFHQGAITDTTVSDQKKMIEVNTNSFSFLLDLASRNQASLVYASSAAVYGNSPSPNRVGKGEIPENVYGYSKYLMDEMTRLYLKKNPELQHSVTGLRYFNVYGPGEYYKGKMASMILQLALKMRRNIPPRLFKFGDQRRDFVFVDDIVQANLKAASAGFSGIFNVGSGVSRTFNEIVAILNEALGTDHYIEYFDNPYTFYQNNTCADIRETRDKLGYTPDYTLEKGIQKTVEWMQSAMKDADPIS
ncbi:MAG: ADP-glyceromanno-heptose 6-epimerase [Candidatus Neomarinimicrobiota bacterium]|nr:ADP-glyceromanno-heptose 6-epimerase [Candidatus Neomarinimicrobiota bacterium]RKY50696.1 MAG: ADP-glyceromanno-heptose 6-epimerase [Candidatus Neomarinimicrobiota bacterium]